MGKIAVLACIRQIFVIVLVSILTGCGSSSDDSDLPDLPDLPDVALSGIIDIEAGTRVDRDNADALLFGDPVVGVQSLPAEFLLAGYVSGSSGMYPRDLVGGFYYISDPVDHYIFPFRSGFEVSLQIFATRANSVSDVTLTLADASGVVVARKTATHDGARVSVSSEGAAEGNYNILVESAGAGPMLYILSAQRVESSQSRSFHWPAYNYVPGEAVVSFKTQPHTFSARSMAQADRELAPGVWVLKQPITVSKLASAQSVDTLTWVESLSQNPSVNWASPNYQTHALSTPMSEPLYSSSVLGQKWHYSLINGPIAWQLAPGGGNNVKVAVMDTGLFYNKDTKAWHSDLMGNVTEAGYDSVDGGAPEDPGNAVGGSVFHGTHVAGTIAAEVNGRGGAGIAFNSHLVPVRVLGEGGTGTLADLIEAMQWVVGLPSDAAQADIVNLSLGGLPCDSPAVSGFGSGSLQSIIKYGTTQKNMLFVAAAGNAATSEKTCPAGLDYVFSVSATDGAGRLASYSNFGPSIDIAAPGGDASRGSSGNSQGDLVSSTSAAIIDGVLTEVYLGLQGTSMAAPHLSGVLALMKSANPSLNYAEVLGYLHNGDLTTSPCDAFCTRTDDLGFGLLDGGKAMQAVLYSGAPELITASPAVVSLATDTGFVGDTTVAISPLGNHGATIESISAAETWFSVVPAAPLPLSIGAGDTLSIKLLLDTERMSPGVSYRSKLDIIYSTDTELSSTLSIPVIGQQITDRQARDAGRHYILLVDPNPDAQGEIYTTVAQTTAVAVNGQYQFSFLPDDGVEPRELNEVPPGRYFLIAGTDLDNDGLICHAGEACAEYPVAGLRQEIVIEEGQSVEGIRMTTSYSRPSFSSASFELPSDFRGYQILTESTDTAKLKAVVR